MSNGEDVLDNWEEIDEVELANKLQKLDEERKLREELNKFPENDIASKADPSAVPGKMKLLQRPPQKTAVASEQVQQEIVEDATSPFDNIQDTFQPVLMVLHKDSDEYQSANYAQPTNTQTVKILRRPTQSSEPRNNGVRPKQPIKTLQQREQEYAEARLRILGAAKNPEDDQAANAALQPNNSTTTPPPPISTAALAATNTSVPTTTTINSSNAQPKINASNRAQQLQQQQQAQQQNQQHYGGALNPYNPYYQQQNFYFPKQQIQQHHTQQQQPLHHSLSSPAFGSNNRSPFMAASLLPTPIAPNAAATVVGMQNRHQFSQQQQSWSPVVGGSVSSYTLQRQQQRQQQQQQQQQQLDVLRTPRGPDGSTGFQMRR